MTVSTMEKSDKNETLGPEETRQRLGALLRGAFDGPPTPLKDIPKRTGQPRQRNLGKAENQVNKSKDRE
jgi:hypothetical protein